MVHALLALSSTILILPEAIWELWYYPDQWHAYLAALVAVASIRNHTTTSVAWQRADRFLVWCIASANVAQSPADMAVYAVLTTVLYFGVVRRVGWPPAVRTTAHLVVHALGVATNVFAVRHNLHHHVAFE